MKVFFLICLMMTSTAFANVCSRVGQGYYSNCLLGFSMMQNGESYSDVLVSKCYLVSPRPRVGDIRACHIGAHGAVATLEKFDNTHERSAFNSCIRQNFGVGYYSFCMAGYMKVKDFGSSEAINFCRNLRLNGQKWACEAGVGSAINNPI